MSDGAPDSLLTCNLSRTLRASRFASVTQMFRKHELAIVLSAAVQLCRFGPKTLAPQGEPPSRTGILGQCDDHRRFRPCVEFPTAAACQLKLVQRDRTFAGDPGSVDVDPG